MQRSEMQSACEEYIQSRDGAVFLVAVSEALYSDGCESVAAVLEAYAGSLGDLGWDLLSLLCPHLTSSHHNTISLCQKITELCSAKEMSLALLEQMESSQNPETVFVILRILKTAVVRLKKQVTLVSSLTSATEIIHRHYMSLGPVQERGVKEEGGAQQEGEPEEKGVVLEGEVESVPKATPTGSLTVPLAASHGLFFVQPLVEAIQPQPYWTLQQRACLSFLLTLLDYPVVSCDLSAVGSPTRAVAEETVELVAQCHCGCLQLLESGGDDRRHTYHQQLCVPIPALGLACCVYLVLVEGVRISYLPRVLQPSYLLHCSLHHSTTLLTTHHHRAVEKGLALLETVLNRVPRHTLPTTGLDDDRYTHAAELLTNIMVTCPYRSLRKKAVPLLLKLISCFTARGRHRLYRGLLLTVDHSGVLGLLTHAVKEEVDHALNSQGASPFLGQDLTLLLRLILRAPGEIDILHDSDRVLTALNFLRYLLIRDSPNEDQSGVWGDVWRVRSEFVEPVRASLEAALYYRRVAAGDQYSSTPDQQALQLAQHCLDMINSVLTRVEELLVVST